MYGDRPYQADRYARDVREWVACTDVDERLRGGFVSFALGGAARRLVDDFEAAECQDGVFVPDLEGGCCHLSAVEVILRVLIRQFFVHVRPRALQRH